MTKNKLAAIFASFCHFDPNREMCLRFENFIAAIARYEVEKAKEKQIIPVKPSDTEIIEYYEQVAKEEYPVEETCKWKVGVKEQTEIYAISESVDKEHDVAVFNKELLAHWKYCPVCGNKIEVVG